MANLTIAVDDEVLLRARKRALDQGTSVNAVLREHLEACAGERSRRLGLPAPLLRGPAERSSPRNGHSTQSICVNDCILAFSNKGCHRVVIPRSVTFPDLPRSTGEPDVGRDGSRWDAQP